MDRGLLWWVVGLFGLVGGLICIIDAYRWNKTRRGLFSFFLLDKKLRLPGYATALVAANFSIGNFIIFISTWGYSFGLSGLLAFLVNLTLNVLGFIVFFPRIRAYIIARDNNGTIHDYLACAFGSAPGEIISRQIRVSASVVTVCCLLLAIIFELDLAVDLLAPANSLERFELFGLLAVLIAAITAYGGFKTLITSDIVNSVKTIIAIAALAILVLTHLHGRFGDVLNHDLSPAAFAKLGWPAIVSIMVIGSGWMLVAMDQWQRSCALEDPETTFRGLSIYLLCLGVCAVCFAIWGGFAANILPGIVQPGTHLSGGTNPLVDIEAIPTSGIFDQMLIALVVSGLVFAAVSTTNTFLTVCSHSLTTDVLVGSTLNATLASLTPEQSRTFTRIAQLVIVGLVSALIVLYVVAVQNRLLTDPLNFFYICYSVQFALLAPMIVSIFSRKFRPGPGAALASIWIGFVVALALGFGSWALTQEKSPPTIGLKAGEWLSLTPVVTLMMGLLPLLLGMRRRA